MTTPDPEWKKVHDAPPEEKLAEFRAYCERMIERKNSGELSHEDATCKICGTGFEALAINGERNDVVSAILDQACDLELPPQHRMATSDWDELVRKVGELPKS